MKKENIKDYMIVETGYDDKKYIVIKGKLINDDMKGYSLDDFDDDLVHVERKAYSISAVYAPIKLKLPFELNVEELIKRHKPKIVWQRKPTVLSKTLLQSMNDKKRRKYLMNITYPCVIGL